VIVDTGRLLGSEALGDALDRLRKAIGPVDELIGWGTVEFERALEELGAPSSVAAPEDALLGARARRCRLEGGVEVVLLEPATEGFLAASLARFGEGPVARYLVGGPGTAEAARRAGFALSPEAGGPLGRQRRVRLGRRWGPHLLLVAAADPARAATIAPMTEQATIALRSATSDDAERIAALLTEEGYPAGPSDIVGRLERFASDYSRVVVADLDGEVLGFIAFHALPRFEHDDRIVRVLALVVDAGARERGVGHRLMGEVERAAGELGAAFVEVTAGHHRPEARQFYESLGYDASVTSYLRKRV
jgi:predicted N-acetyltransferase YhbS